jgi:hypothetical protein
VIHDFLHEPVRVDECPYSDVGSYEEGSRAFLFLEYVVRTPGLVLPGFGCPPLGVQVRGPMTGSAVQGKKVVT